MEHGLAIVLTALVLYLLAREVGVPAPRTTAGSLMLTYGPVVRGTGWVTVSLPLTALMLGFTLPGDLFGDPVFVGFLLLITLLAFRVARAILGQRILADSIGLQSSVWGRENWRLSWAEVTQVTHTRPAGNLVFHTLDGRKLRINQYRRGVNELDRFMRLQLPLSVWELAFHRMIAEQARLV